MDDKTIFLALPLGARFQCPICVTEGVSVIRKREALKKHFNKDHGAGWEVSFVCCDVEYSCRQHKYVLKKARAHFEEAHPGTPYELDNEEELGLVAITYEELQEKIVRLANPPQERQRSPASTPPPSPGSPVITPPLLLRARTAAAIARNALRQRPGRDAHLLTPPRAPINAGTAPGPQANPPAGQPIVRPVPSPPQSPPSPGHQEVGEADLFLPPPELSAWQRQWVARFPIGIQWGDFLAALEELTTSLAPTQPNQRPQRPRGGHRRNQNAAGEAARIQRAYRMAPSKAMKEVLGDKSPPCTIPEATIVGHFQESYRDRPGCVGPAPINCAIPAAPTPPPLLNPTTPAEVARLLARTSNTAPGPDGLKYAVWRRRDRSGHVLAAIFNVCIAARRFPSAWKESSTVLIYKKGAVDEITNWRPIALSNTAGKLMCALLADRISKWASTHHLIAEAQKGFQPSEGCLEHNFVLQEILDDARRRGTEVCVAWLDLANAFGSVPHAALRTALHTAGMTEEQLDFIGDLYSGSATAVRHSSGVTAPINFAAGVRQGCPLSPILFNLVMEFLIRPLLALQDQHGATLHNINVAVLAYADDLALVARSEDSLRALIDVVTPAADWVGLRFKPAKCATLHVAQRRVLPTRFSIYGEPLRSLAEGESYQHLGVPTGFKTDQTPVATITRLEDESKKIFDSLLAPWQKLHALRTFLVPQVEFHLNTARIRKTALRGLDLAMKKGCKGILNLPSRASAELVYIPPSSGGAGLIPLTDLSDLAAVSHAFRLLTSPDERVSSIAMEGLAASAGLRSARRVDMASLVSYLNGERQGNSNYTSTFSTARAALGRIKKKIQELRWGYSEARGLQLFIPSRRDMVIVDSGARKNLTANLRAALQLHYKATLAAKPDQGRVARVTTTCPTSNHMLYEGRYTRFADWRFMHRARLNVLPLNGCRRWGAAADRRCRRCGRYDETTAHVLCHCTKHLATGILKRHNAVLDQLAAAVRPQEGEEVRVNQTVPLSTLLGGRPTGREDDIPERVARCRPDLVVIDKIKKTVKIVDVTVAYEDGWQAIETARNNKYDAYAPLARILTAEGYKTTVDAFVVGALGAWDNTNWNTLKNLNVSRRYGVTLSRRCVSEAVRWSRDIYVTHITGVQQWPQDNLPDLQDDNNV